MPPLPPPLTSLDDAALQEQPPRVPQHVRPAQSDEVHQAPLARDGRRRRLHVLLGVDGQPVDGRGDVVDGDLRRRGVLHLDYHVRCKIKFQQR